MPELWEALAQDYLTKKAPSLVGSQYGAAQPREGWLQNTPAPPEQPQLGTSATPGYVLDPSGQYVPDPVAVQQQQLQQNRAGIEQAYQASPQGFLEQTRKLDSEFLPVNPVQEVVGRAGQALRNAPLPVRGMVEGLGALAENAAQGRASLEGVGAGAFDALTFFGLLPMGVVKGVAKAGARELAYGAKNLARQLPHGTKIPAEHLTARKGLSTIDPAMAGTNKSMAGAETAREGQVPGSFWNNVDVQAYPEANLGNEGYRASLKRVLMPGTKPQKKILAKARANVEKVAKEEARAGGYAPVIDPQAVASEFEQIALRTGYYGYASNTPAGQVVKYFDAVAPTQRTRRVVKRPTQENIAAYMEQNPGGGSIYPNTGTTPVEGIAIAQRGNEQIVQGRPTGGVLSSYLEKTGPRKGDEMVGWWGNEGKTYLDTSKIYTTPLSARVAGEMNYQKAGYDVGKGAEVPMTTRPLVEGYANWRAANQAASRQPREFSFPPGQRGAVGDLSKQYEGQRISTRYPTALKATEDPIKENLIVGLESSTVDPVAFEHNIKLMSDYDNFGGIGKNKIQDQSKRIIEHMQSNLNYLYEQMPPAIRARAQKWYDGANKMANDISKKYNISTESASAVYASLSPKTDWFVNVARGDRLIDIYHTQKSTPWSEEMSVILPNIQSKISNPKAKQAILGIQGKKLGDLDGSMEKGLWIRLYDEAHNSKHYRIVTPEGGYGEFMLNKGGSKAKMAWSSPNEMAKAVSVLDDPSVANISEKMGMQHKVRNFYNNIVAPNSKFGDVTIDTHAVSANLMQPYAMADAPVLHNFGSGETGFRGPASSSITGNQGTYGIHAEAVRRAASDQGVLPRQMQSITWEGIRGIFTNKSPKIKASAARIWNGYSRGLMTQKEAQDAIMDLAKGMDKPAWSTQ